MGVGATPLGRSKSTLRKSVFLFRGVRPWGWNSGGPRKEPDLVRGAWSPKRECRVRTPEWGTPSSPAGSRDRFSSLVVGVEGGGKGR